MIIVRNGQDIEKVIRLLQRMMNKDGDLRRLKERERYIRRGERRRAKHQTHLGQIKKLERKHEVIY